MSSTPIKKCYRQKENVGIATKVVIDNVAQSTPFLREDKIENFYNNHVYLTTVSNELLFQNPHGYVQNYPNATEKDVRVEVSRILQSQALFWNHWPSLLLLTIDCELPEKIQTKLKPLMNKNYVRELRFSSITQIKGLEYQHVFIFLYQSLFQELQRGFKGSGQKTYHYIRLLRIPFSRAKDSLVVFAI